MYHQCLYKRSVRLFELEKDHILTAELYCPVRSFDKEIYIRDTCHKHLSRNEMPCQAFFNKTSLDPIPDELNDFIEIEKIIISKRIIFNKIAIMPGKEEFAKIMGSICNATIEAKNIHKNLPRPADSNGLSVVKLKGNLK